MLWNLAPSPESSLSDGAILSYTPAGGNFLHIVLLGGQKLCRTPVTTKVAP